MSCRHKPWRLLVAGIAAGVHLATTACTHLRPLDHRDRARLGTIVVAQSSYVPESSFITFAKGRLAGAGKGAAYGIAEGLHETVREMSAGAVSAGPYTGAVYVIVAMMYMAVGAAVGAVSGTQEAVPADKARDIEASVDKALQEIDAQRHLADHLTARLVETPGIGVHPTRIAGPTTPHQRPNYSDTLSAQPVDTVLESSVRSVGFEGGRGDSPLIHFYLLADVRLLRVTDGESLYAREFRYSSPPLRLETWLANGGERLAVEFDRAYRNLAARIGDELFVVTDFPFDSGFWALPGSEGFGACWLKPIYPELKRWSMGEHFEDPERAKRGPPYPKVDTPRPTLRWETFPRPRDVEKQDRKKLDRIREVRYELRIWRVEDHHRGALVYDRADLAEPAHRLEYALDSNTRYFWTFRARYRMDDRQMATRWAFALTAPGTTSCERDDIPPAGYFRFITPP